MDEAYTGTMPPVTHEPRLTDESADAGTLDKIRRFARRRPAVFVTAATIAGFVIGRLLRGKRT